MKMYKPAPPRPKKTNIVRSRNGCKSCRERKTKCDEKQPICGTCARLGKACERYRPEFKFESVNPSIHKDNSLATNKALEKQQTRTQLIQKEHQANTLRKASFQIENIDFIRSLQHSERDIFYWTVWEDYCLPAMHPIFYFLSKRLGSHPFFADATLALSSCSFSRLHPEQKHLVTSQMGSWSPQLIHQTRSQLYYSSAIRRFTSLITGQYHEDIIVIFTVLVVFAHIECSMGNFSGFYCHDQGIISVLPHLNASFEPRVDDLLAAWLQVRAVIWWARAYFCSLDVQRQLPPVIPSGINMENFLTPKWRRVTVLSIMCESHRVNFSALLKFWDTSDFGAEARGSCATDEELEISFTLLYEHGRQLDKWIENLPFSELPINGPNDLGDICDMDDQTPIHFHSHESALNFAYYTLARILQCEGLLRSLQTISSHSSYVPYDFHMEESWIQLLLRIARGTNMETSLKMNKYTIGFSGLLLSALLRCRTPSLALEIQDWLQNLEALKPTEEGAFPLYQTLCVVKMINRQKIDQRDVVAVTLSVDDDGGTPKVSSYNSQPIFGLLFHGVSRNSESLACNLFTDYLTIDP